MWFVQSKTLVSCPQEFIDGVTSTDDKQYLMRFDEFNQSSVKNKVRFRFCGALLLWCSPSNREWFNPLSAKGELNLTKSRKLLNPELSNKT